MKLIAIISLFPVFCFGQPTIAEKSTGFSTLGIGSTGGVNMLAGKLYILFAGTSNAGGTPATISAAGTGQTWTEIGTAGGVVNTTSHKRIQVFRFAPASDNSNTINYTYTGTQDGGWIALYEISNCTVSGTNGANAIVQIVTATDNATQNPNITLSALRHNSSVITGWINDVNPPTGTAEAGWTEDEDNGYATPDTGGYIMSRSNTTDNTPSWTAGAFSNWAGIAIEIRDRIRRSTVIN